MPVELKELRQRALEEGKTVDEVVEQLLKEEEENKGKMVRIQIMPFQSIAGYGSFPSVVDMPEDKAQDLAKYGKVHIINSNSDIIDEDDEEAIAALQAEMLTIRRSKEKGNRPVFSHLVNRKKFLKKKKEEAEAEDNDEGGVILEQKPNRGSRRVMQRR